MLASIPKRQQASLCPCHLEHTCFHPKDSRPDHGHPSLTSICPFVHLFSSPSIHCLSTLLSYLSFSLVITHSLSSLICAEPALHGVLRISRGTSSQPMLMECRYWCVCRKEAAFLCIITIGHSSGAETWMTRPPVPGQAFILYLLYHADD